jgi:hypothetical protein
MNISSISGFDPTKLWENLFKKVDSNSDGGIDKTEFESAVSTMAKNQNLSTDEADAMFKKLDADGDGKVSEKEMMAALKMAGDQMRANMPPPPPPPNGATDATSTADATAETDGQNAMFSDLIKSLQSSDARSATSSSDNSSVSSLFSDLVESLKSSNGNDDEIASLINNFLQELQTSTQYTQSGSLTASTSTTQSLLAAMA